MNLNISELYKQYAQKSFIGSNDGPSGHVAGNYATNSGPGNTSLQQYFHASTNSSSAGGGHNQQRTAATGQTKHRAISVTEAPQNLIDPKPHHLGFQHSVNGAMGGLNQTTNQFGVRHNSQSSQQANRKNYKVDLPGFVPSNSRHTAMHMPGSAGPGSIGPAGTGGMLVTTAAGGGSGGAGSG